MFLFFFTCYSFAFKYQQVFSAPGSGRGCQDGAGHRLGKQAPPWCGDKGGLSQPSPAQRWHEVLAAVNIFGPHKRLLFWPRSQHVTRLH